MLRAFLAKPASEFRNGDSCGLMLVADFDRVADVVAVGVGAEHDVEMLDGLFFFRRHGIVHDPRVDEDGFAAGRLNAKGGVSEPGEFNAFEVHSRWSLVVGYELLGMAFGFAANRDCRGFLAW